MYRNTYLDKVGELLQKAMEVARDIEKAVKELTDEEKIREIFRGDVEYIMNKFYGGDITDKEALNNLNMLKAYAISQLSTHVKRIVDVLDDLERKVKRLKEEATREDSMKEVVRDIVETIRKAEAEIKY